MSDERPINAGDTYVFDEDDLGQLDELTLTTVISEAATSLDPPQDAPRMALPDF